MMKKPKKKSRGVVVHVGQFEFLKINTGKREWRDAYHWILSLSWPQFFARSAQLRGTQAEVS